MVNIKGSSVLSNPIPTDTGISQVNFLIPLLFNLVMDEIVKEVK